MVVRTKSTSSHLAVRLGAACTFASLLLAAGCTLTPPERTSPEYPFHLLHAAALQIPRGCEPAPGMVYRTAYTVRADGSVAAAVSESGAGCVQEALRQWVATFRYGPIREDTATVIDWLSVTATRGT
jgi:hypothetical protein